MKNLSTFLVFILFVLFACQVSNDQKLDTNIESTKPKIVNDSIVIKSIGLSSGKYQNFIVNYKHLQNDRVFSINTKVLHYNIGDTILKSNL